MHMSYVPTASMYFGATYQAMELVEDAHALHLVVAQLWMLDEPTAYWQQTRPRCFRSIARLAREGAILTPYDITQDVRGMTVGC